MTRLFDHEYLDPHFLQDLDTLAREGAVYAQFWREEVKDFRFCRIRFTPAEIVAYVEASRAYDEFERYYQVLGDPSAALDRITDEKVRNRVREYNRWTRSVGQNDTQYCHAAFLGEDLEDLVCGGQPHRYDYLSENYTADRRFLLTEILEIFPAAVAILTQRTGGRTSYVLEEEQDIRDLLYLIIKSIFPDDRIEECTRIHAGCAKRVDIVVPLIATLVEVKFVRNDQHAKKIADELRVDFESDHAHIDCEKIIAYVWDPLSHLRDRPNFISDLRGLRQKGDSRFNVEVLVKL